jgi:hypothetical protein
MGSHLIDGKFQSDKYPTTPRGKVPLSVKDKSAQDLLWEYAQRRRSVDTEFSEDLEQALRIAGYIPPQPYPVAVAAGSDGYAWRHVHRWHLSTKIERVSETSVLQTVSFDDDGPVIVSDYSVENARKIGELLI